LIWFLRAVWKTDRSGNGQPTSTGFTSGGVSRRLHPGKALRLADGFVLIVKYIKITVILVGLVAGAVAQAPKKTISQRPNLRESFAKASLKALLAIGDFKGTGSLTGPAQDAYEDARATGNSTSAPETLMLANLRDLAIMRSTDNLAREKIIAQLEKTPKDQELSAALVSIDKRESECLASLERAFRNRIAIPLPGMCTK
jgi:hypothetical protein